MDVFLLMTCCGYLVQTKKNLSQSDLGTSETSQERAFQGNVSEYLKGDGEDQVLL